MHDALEPVGVSVGQGDELRRGGLIDVGIVVGQQAAHALVSHLAQFQDSRGVGPLHIVEERQQLGAGQRGSHRGDDAWGAEGLLGVEVLERFEGRGIRVVDIVDEQHGLPVAARCIEDDAQHRDDLMGRGQLVAGPDAGGVQLGQ